MRRANFFAPPRRSGFALIVVIWGLGVITLLISSFMTTATGRLQTAANIAGAAQARLVAEGAVNAAVLSLLTERNSVATAAQKPVHDGTPQLCAMDGAAVAVSIEDEGGKVDLNSATPQLLTSLFTGFGVNPQDADAIAQAIVLFRTPPTNDIAIKTAGYESAGRPFGPKRAPFQTILELDQVAGVDNDVFRSVLPFVTIHSRAAGVDPMTAPPALFAALSGVPIDDVRELVRAPFPNRLNRKDPRFASTLNQGGPGAGAGGAFLLHVEVRLPTGQLSVSETVVDLASAGGEPFAIREVRNGATRYRDDLQSAMGGLTLNLPPC